MSENHENQSPPRPGLFAELAQLAGERTVLMTVSTVDGALLCVNFVPKRLTPSEEDALTTPLCLTGTPEELDRDLVGQIRSYVAAHRALSSNLAQAQHAMAEASKRAREENAKRRPKPPEQKPECQNNIGRQKAHDEASSDAAAVPAVQPSLSLFDQPEDQDAARERL